MNRLEVGARLGNRYVLDELLARREGGTLDYWVAHDSTLGRLVAVTVLPADGEHRQTADAVVDGARRVASVDDPRLVRVLDVGEEDGLCWIVEEGLSEAESLASLVSEHPLPAEEARRIIGESAAALESARRRGLHHLYLNPHSILRTSDGTVKVSGVGMAAALEGTDDVTAAEASIIDTADLVSLLHTGLTGQWPGEDMPGLNPARRLADGSVAAPSEVVSGVPGDLDALCRLVNGVESDLSRAPHSPGELARQLAPWASEMVRGQRPGSIYPHATGDATTGAITRAAGASAAATAAHPTRTDDTEAVAPVRPATGPDPDAAFRRSHDHDAGTSSVERPGLFQSELDASAGDDHDARRRPSTAEILGVRSGDGRGERRPGGPGGSSVGSSAVGARGAVGAGGAGRVGEAGGAGDRGEDGGLREEHGTGVQTIAVLLVVLGIIGLAAVLGWSVLRGLGGGSDDDPAGTTPGATAGATAGETGGATSEPTSGGAEEPEEPEEEPDPTAPPAVDGVLPVLGVNSFDPQGDGDENRSLAPLAVDGDEGTEWTSQTYYSPGWGGQKSGTGLVLDLGVGATVSSVDVLLGEGDMGARLLLGDRPTLAGSTELGADDAASGTWTVTPDQPATGRYLILWFDRAYSSSAGEVVAVREITVH